MPSFVVQKHAATRLHKRLAVQVEDHPLSWGEFEGRIEAGYGAGKVIVWDRGTWSPLGEVPFARALDEGHASFELHGRKLRGGFTLRRMHGGEKPQWLLIKRRDERACDGCDVTAEHPESVVSGRRIEDV